MTLIPNTMQYNKTLFQHGKNFSTLIMMNKKYLQLISKFAKLLTHTLKCLLGSLQKHVIKTFLPHFAVY